MIKSLSDTKINELDFEHCGLTDTKIEIMACALKELRGSFAKENLNLSGNYQISDNGRSMIDEAFEDIPQTVSDSSSKRRYPEEQSPKAKRQITFEDNTSPRGIQRGRAESTEVAECSAAEASSENIRDSNISVVALESSGIFGATPVTVGN